MLTMLFDGVAYGMLLFILAIGLSVTLGLMNFINLAHGVFAMVGGYIIITLTQKFNVSFYWGLPLTFISVAALGAVFERILYRPMYKKSHLEQVLFSLGLTFMAVAATHYFMGPGQYNIHLPEELRGRTIIGMGGWTIGIGHYRLFLIGVCAVLTLTLQFVLDNTNFGCRLRAAVDDPAVAGGLGINVNLVLFLTFAFGSGLAGLGGALGIEIMGLDSVFALRYLVYFLMVVAMGGTSSITGPFLAALFLGIADEMGKYYFPGFSGFAMYLFMILLLLWRPDGLFARQGRLA